MTKDLNRLEAILPEVHVWALDDSYLFQNSIQKYSEKIVPLYKANMELNKLAMKEIKLGLIAAEENHLSQSVQHLHCGEHRNLINMALELISFKNTKRLHYLTLDSVVLSMLSGIALGDIHTVRQFDRVLMQLLDSGFGIRNGHQYQGPETFRFAAMGLSIIHDWLELPLDLDQLGLARDPAWGKLVSHWREPDVEKLLPILNAACDVHVERIWLSDGDKEGEFEFDSPYKAVYPMEILAVLRLRDMLGLPNPVIDHPLMQTLYAKMTAMPGEVTAQDTPLEAFLNAVRERDPEIMRQWDAAAYQS